MRGREQVVDRIRLSGDIVEARAKATGEKAGVPFFTNYEKMLAEVPCDAVAIATPSGLHPAHGILAAKAGKHVISEKPMAISLASADALVQATATHPEALRRLLAVVSPLLPGPPWRIYRTDAA